MERGGEGVERVVGGQGGRGAGGQGKEGSVK